MSGFLELWRLTKRFAAPAALGSPVAVVKDFSLAVGEGEIIALLGHSGCGKSTVLSMVAGLTPLSGGGIILDDAEVTGPGTDRGIVFQAPCLLPWLTALENVRLAVDQVAGDRTRRERRAVAAAHLEQVGLADSLDRRPDELSSGMRQRVGIARALALAPKLLLLDEPFGMLDSLTRIELQDLLLRLWEKERKTALLVTHDVDEAILLADRVVLMTSGPEATVGRILSIDFPRPRERRSVLEDPRFEALRGEVLAFLDSESTSQTPPPSEREPRNSKTPAKTLARESVNPRNALALAGTAAVPLSEPWTKG